MVLWVTFSVVLNRLNLRVLCPVLGQIMEVFLGGSLCIKLFAVVSKTLSDLILFITCTCKL